jgi:hypothetical protein
MELTIKLEDEKKLKALKNFLKSFEIPFKTQKKEKEHVYGPKFRKDMKEAEEDIKARRIYKVALKDIWNEEAWVKAKTWK